MSFVKSLIGSLLGAAVGVAVYFGIQKTTGQSYIWFPLVIGVLTGTVARILAGRAQSDIGRYANGALAGLIAGAAILSIDFIPTLLAEKADYGPIELNDRVTATANTRVDRKSSDGTKSGSEGKTDVDPETDQETGIVSDAEADSKTEAGADSPTKDAATKDRIGSTSEEDSDDLNKDKVDSTADDNSPDPEVERQADDQNADSAKPDNPLDMMKRDRTAGPNTPNNSEANTKRYYEIIKKQTHQPWYKSLLPHVFTGLGMLVAYQLVRGFGSASPKK